MITNARKTKESREGRKVYYVFFQDNEPIGVMSNEYSAITSLQQIAQKKNAVCLSSHVYKYDDESGEHLIRLRQVKKLIL